MSSLGGLITGDLNRVLDVNRPSTCKSYCNPYQRQLENGRLCPTRFHQSNCRLLVGIYTGKILSATVNKIELATTSRPFSKYDFVTIARAIEQLHETEKLWQDPRGRTCLRSSAFAAKPPGK